MTSRSHQGLVRLNNEDCVHCDAEDRFVVLADGMGGLLAGELASAIAVDTACKGLRNPHRSRNNGDDIACALDEAHAAVVARAKRMRYVGKMGTTLVAWALSRDSTHEGAQVSYFSHVGDSRLYAYNAGELTQITRDHTMAQRLIDDGTIAPEDEHTAPNRHVLTQAMGLPGIFGTDAGEVPPCERILLCSDGLSDLVTATQIAEIMTTLDLDDCANLLLKAALDKGGRDNVTVALIEF